MGPSTGSSDVIAGFNRPFFLRNSRARKQLQRVTLLFSGLNGVRTLSASVEDSLNAASCRDPRALARRMGGRDGPRGKARITNWPLAETAVRKVCRHDNLGNSMKAVFGRVCIASALSLIASACGFPSYDFTRNQGDASGGAANGGATAGGVSSAGAADSGASSLGEGGSSSSAGKGGALAAGGTSGAGHTAGSGGTGAITPGTCGKTCVAPASCWCCGRECYCTLECSSDDVCSTSAGSSIATEYNHCNGAAQPGICTPPGACAG
jgi:hypothetical protein